MSPGHDGEVVSVQEQLPQQLEGLPPRDVVVRLHQESVVVENPVVVLLQELTGHYLVPREELPQGSEGVGSDVEDLELHVLEEEEEVVRVEDQPRERLVTQAFPKHQAVVKRNLARHQLIGRDSSHSKDANSPLGSRSRAPGASTPRGVPPSSPLSGTYGHTTLNPRQLIGGGPTWSPAGA